MKKNINNRLKCIKGNLATNWNLYLFLIPFALLAILFGVYPIIKSILMSTYDSSTFYVKPTFVGFKNYMAIFKDDLFWKSLWITVKFTLISVPLNIVVALILAQALTYKGIKKFSLFFKLAIFIPVVTPDVVGAIVWKWVFNTKLGSVNAFLALFGMEPIGWLTDPKLTLSVLAFIELWKHVGLYTIIFATNYQMIDKAMYEASYIDGTNAIQRYFYITLPALKPAFVMNSVYALIQFLKTYTVSKIITQGGPNYASNFISFYAYEKFNKLQIGEATAMATILFIIVIIVSKVSSKRLEGDEA